MPRKKSAPNSRGQQFSAERFLRSINLCHDATAPERISHFRPTSKSVSLVRGLFAEQEHRAFFIIAPYGSGKSITLTYLLHAIENRPESREALKTIESRLKRVSPDLHKLLHRRRQQKKQGLTIALHGHCPNLSAVLKKAVLEAMHRMRLGRQARTIEKLDCNTIDEAVELLVSLREKCQSCKLDRISLLWDEVGRHIEALVSQGHAAELADIQVLAEFVSRSEAMPMTLGLALHQGLLHYAGQMSQSVRAEWMKISGRFQEIHYIDDSKEIYRLVSEVVEANRCGIGRLPKNRIGQVARRCRDDLGMFSGFTLSELAETLERAYPLEPIAFYLLPRISARVAQYERTLFTFLYAADISRPISVADLYDYFSPVMRADTAVGGTYKQWLETQSAMSKAEDDLRQVQVLKTTCLLGLGTSGERARAGQEMVLTALAGYEEEKPWCDVIESLVQRNLLLHRKHNDELSVWHGTDVDLRSRLEEAKHRYSGSFNLQKFLEQEAVPRAWKPLRHNSEYGVCRYWAGEYLPLEDFATIAAGQRDICLPVGCDGKVLYLLAEDSDQIQQGVELVRRGLSNPRVIAVVPTEPLQAREAALEVFCLTQMAYSSDLVGKDPLVLPQLQQMADDARSQLQRVMDRFLCPGPDGPKWFCRGKDIVVRGTSDLRRVLSDISDDVFRLTPKIRNELIVRRKPSGTIINSRKKLLLGILERHGEENLGIRGHFPDYSMFRTVLLHTGLYQERDDRWDYVAPSCKKLAPGVAAVWKKLREFFSVPSDEPKKPAELLEELREPPYGVREGLLPILFAAGFKAFARVVSLMREGRYLTDVMPDNIEDLCQNPQAYELQVLDLSDTQLRYLRRLHSCFSPVPDNVVAENDLIRLCHDAVQGWKFQLPTSALTTKNLSESTRHFQKLLQEEMDPVRLLLADLPEITGARPSQVKKLISGIQRMKEELEAAARTFVDQASSSVRKALTHSTRKNGSSLRDLASVWALKMSSAVPSDSVPAVAKGLLTRMQTEYDTDELLTESLSLLLVGRPLSRWDDSTAVTFGSRLHDMVHRIEEAVLNSGSERRGDDTWEGVKLLMRQRLDELFHQLVGLVGPDEAEQMLQDVLERNLDEARHGDTR